MSNPTETHRPDPASWRLVLDEGEQLGVRLIPSAEPSGRAEVEVRMSAMRADDLSRVLTGYSRVVAIMSETSEVSSTEESLARGLRDAAAVARARDQSQFRRRGSGRPSGSRQWPSCSRRGQTSLTPS